MADPAFHLEGIPEDLFEPVEDAVLRALNGKRHGDLEENVRLAARKAAHAIWGKKPIVRVETVEV